MGSTDGRYDFGLLKVLIADDSQHMRTLLFHIIRSMGIRSTETVHNGLEAYETFGRYNPDIVITDWYMEPCNGLELIRRIRDFENSPNPFVPIMMLTGHTEAWRIARARDAGVNVFVAKPIDPARLLQNIVKIIEDPRPFIRAGNYCGPDRRWKDQGPPAETGERRKRVGGMRW